VGHAYFVTRAAYRSGSRSGCLFKGARKAPTVTDNRVMIRSVNRTARRQQQAADLAFWLSRPMAERIAAVEALRQPISDPADTPDAEPRLQRICRVAQRQGR
jgi:hypothetical protein